MSKIFYYFNLKFKNESADIRTKDRNNDNAKRNAEAIKLIRPNHPSNCRIFDLSTQNISKEDGLYQVQLNFRPKSNFSVEIFMVDRNQQMFRTFKHNSFANTGPRISISDLGSAVYKYVIESSNSNSNTPKPKFLEQAVVSFTVLNRV